VCGTCHHSRDPLFPDAGPLTECLDCHSDSPLPRFEPPDELVESIAIGFRERGLFDEVTPIGQERLEDALREAGYGLTDVPVEADRLLEVELEWREATPTGLYLRAEIPILLSVDAVVTARYPDGSLALRDSLERFAGFGRSVAAARSSALWPLTRAMSARLQVLLAGGALPDSESPRVAGAE